MQVAAFSSEVFRFLPPFGDSSEALLLLVTPLKDSFLWWFLWSTPSFGDSFEALLLLVTPLKNSPHVFPLLLQNFSNKKNQLVGERNKSEWKSLCRCLKANVEKSLHVFTVNLNTIYQTWDVNKTSCRRLNYILHFVLNKMLSRQGFFLLTIFLWKWIVFHLGETKCLRYLGIIIYSSASNCKGGYTNTYFSIFYKVFQYITTLSQFAK